MFGVDVSIVERAQCEIQYYILFHYRFELLTV